MILTAYSVNLDIVSLEAEEEMDRTRIEENGEDDDLDQVEGVVFSCY